MPEVGALAEWVRSCRMQEGRHPPRMPGQRASAAREALRVIVRAMDVLEDRDAALEWLTTPSDLFSGKAPMQLLNTSTGADLVLDQLVRMEHGVYS